VPALGQTGSSRLAVRERVTVVQASSAFYGFGVTGRQALRDLIVALVAAIATASGLVAVAPVPWSIALTLALFVATAALAVDIIVFDRPIQRRSRIGRYALPAIGTTAALSALACSFLIGQEVQRKQPAFTFLVTNSGGVLTLARSVPYDDAQTNRTFETGDSVAVECKVLLRDEIWYKLADGQGWLNEKELMAAPYTGEGVPPRCPD